MKLLLLKPYLVAKTNGGEISMIERLRQFQSWGWKVAAHIAVPESIRGEAEKLLSSMDTPLNGNSYSVDGISCEVAFGADFHPTDLKRQGIIEKHFLSLLEREKPDLVWAHYTDYFAVTSAVKWNADRAWIVQTDNEYPRQSDLNQFPSVASEYLKIKTLVVASRFMQKSCRAALPWAQALRIPNPIEQLKSEPIKRDPQVWVFVNPTQVKGVEFVIELAKRLPNEAFLFVGNWTDEMPRDLPKNITAISRQKNLKEVFSKAKGLLMPSVWQEAFGRLVLEAMAAGVPVISSDRGSLPETVSDGGLSLGLDFDLWIEAMQKPETFWRAQVEGGFQRIKRYEFETIRRFQALQRLLKRL